MPEQFASASGRNIRWRKQPRLYVRQNNGDTDKEQQGTADTIYGKKRNDRSTNIAIQLVEEKGSRSLL